MSNRKDISIIIPCYNTKAEYLQEAVNSVLAYKGAFSYEIIITDDGSTNENTLNRLAHLSEKGVTVLHQENKGPAAARNTGIRNTKSEFILFLDSDDRLKPEYIEEGVLALKQNKKAGVVYAKADAFGDETRTNFITGKFDVIKLLIHNYIPMCSVIRRKVWEDVDGLDENLIHFEDWEFWVNTFKAGWEFIFINRPMFEYRIRKESLMAQADKGKYEAAGIYIYQKHSDLVFHYYQQLYATRIIYENDVERPLRSFIKYSKKKYFN